MTDTINVTQCILTSDDENNCIACGRDMQQPFHMGCDQKLAWAVIEHIYGPGANKNGRIWEIAKNLGVGSTLGTADEIIRGRR